MLIIQLIFIALCLTAAAVACGLSHRVGSSRGEVHGRGCADVLFDCLFAGAPPLVAAGCRNRRTMSETAAIFGTVICGFDHSRLARLVSAGRLDTFLLRRARRVGRWGRAHCLRLLACLPLSEESFLRALRLRDGGCDYLRLCKLLLRINQSPEDMVREIEKYPGPLSALGLSEVMTMLRRSSSRVEYESMILSDNRNVKLLGLLIVRLFGAEEAADLVYGQVTSEAEDIRLAALLTLSSLRLPLNDPGVVAAVVAMCDADRRRLYRRLVADGYSLRALKPLTVAEGGETGRYIERMIRSYKRSIPRPVL